jgi:hypothetical protein
MDESHKAFIFMEGNVENNNKNQLFAKNKMDWKPIMAFYAKTTAWIIFPLILATWAGDYLSQSTQSQILFFVLVIVGFGVTCFGVYKEIKEYKESLDIGSNKENKVKNEGK